MYLPATACKCHCNHQLDNCLFTDSNLSEFFNIICYWKYSCSQSPVARSIVTKRGKGSNFSFLQNVFLILSFFSKNAKFKAKSFPILIIKSKIVW